MASRIAQVFSKNICARQSLKAWFYGGSRQEQVKNANRLARKANKNNL